MIGCVEDAFVLEGDGVRDVMMLGRLGSGWSKRASSADKGAHCHVPWLRCLSAELDLKPCGLAL